MTDIGGPAISSDEFFKAAEAEGKLVLFLGHAKEKFYDKVQQQEKVIARCELVIILDADDGPQVFVDALVFGAALAPSVYRASTPGVLGTIGTGEEKDGKSAPWILIEATDTQAEAARNWFGKYVITDRNGVYKYGADEAPF